jgi:hypothetical protein
VTVTVQADWLATSVLLVATCDVALRRTPVSRSAGPGGHAEVSWLYRTPHGATRRGAIRRSARVEETWSTPEVEVIRATIPGKLGEMSGAARLREFPGVTTENVDLTLKVSIPLLGVDPHAT